MFGWLKGRKKTGIPKLYDNIETPEFCRFMSVDSYKAIRKFPRLTILPLSSANDCEEENYFGAGFSRLIIRNLMLVRNISILGPGDTPTSPLSVLQQHSDYMKSGIFVGGSVRCRSHQISITLTVIAVGGKAIKRTIEEPDGPSALHACCELIAKSVRGRVTDDTRRMWIAGVPTDFFNYVTRLGFMRLGLEREDPDRCKLAIELAKESPNLAVAADGMTNDCRQLMLDLMKQDPYDAHICFLLFILFWESTGHEPEAFQFIRRGIELAPGHGKCHMCAPHAAHPDSMSHMLMHSELGYVLLPNNTFAINNYVINLLESDRPPSEAMAIAEKGIATDPYDPGNYNRMIELFMQMGNNKMALQLAYRLDDLYHPMHKRTAYCLRQNPQCEMLMDAGEYDPVVENRHLIQKLESTLRSA